MSLATLEKNLTLAHQEWISRPDDERYLSLDDLYEAVCGRANESRVLTVPNRSLVVRGSEFAGGSLTLEQEDVGILDPTHWSLGQLATLSHTPAKACGILRARAVPPWTSCQTVRAPPSSLLAISMMDSPSFFVKSRMLGVEAD